MSINNLEMDGTFRTKTEYAVKINKHEIKITIIEINNNNRKSCFILLFGKANAITSFYLTLRRD